MDDRTNLLWDGLNMNMNIEHDPWNESHAPQKFHRTDPTGRWSPVHEEPSIPDTLFIKIMAGLWGAIAVCMLVFALFAAA